MRLKAVSDLMGCSFPLDLNTRAATAAAIAPTCGAGGWSHQNRMMTLFKSPVQLCLKLILRKSTGEKRKQGFTLHCIQTLWNESIDSLVGILERWKLFYPINMDWSCDFFGRCSDSGGGGVHFLFLSESAQDAAKLGLAYCRRREEAGVSQAFQSTARNSASNPIHSDYRWMREVSGDQNHPAEPSLRCWPTGFGLNKELGFVIVVVNFWLHCMACRILLPDQGSKPHSLQWDHGILTTRSPKESKSSCFNYYMLKESHYILLINN